MLSAVMLSVTASIEILCKQHISNFPTDLENVYLNVSLGKKVFLSAFLCISRLKFEMYLRLFIMLKMTLCMIFVACRCFVSPGPVSQNFLGRF